MKTMSIHREGYRIIAYFFLGLAALCTFFFLVLPLIAALLLLAAAVIFFGLILYFFRHPKRILPQPGDQLIYAPADGKVVVIEQTEESEYFQDKRRQISIFMSPLNVHVNRVPISGKVDYYQYHPGKYLVAWHPKSSTENERATLVIQGKKGPVLIRQIAGAVARRICTYPLEGSSVVQGEQLGFIKFGSRVDVFLPTSAEIKVNIGDQVVGGRTVLAVLK